MALGEEQISLLAVYDKVAALDGKVGAMIARVDERLDHGGRRMEDHEQRMRLTEAAIPPRLGERLASIESQLEQRRGGLGAWSTVGAFVGSSTVAVVLSLLVAWLSRK